MTEQVETPESIADALTAVMAESDTETEEVTEVSQETEATTETEEVEVETTEVEEDDDESEEQEAVFQAPEHWSSDEREGFDALAPEAKELLLKRDAQFQTGYQEKAQAISAITDAIEPFKETLIRRGLSPEQAIGILFNAQDRLDKNPLDGILQIAQSYGVVDQLKSKFVPQTDDEDFTDPGIKALQEEVRGLKGQIDQTQQGIQQQVIDAGNLRIDNFKTETDKDGNLKYPHFEKVMNLVTSYVGDGETLESAYEKAVWTIPEFRDSQVKKDVEKTDQEKAAKVKKAKKAARSNRLNGKADVDEGKEALTLKEDLKEAFRQHSS